MLSATVALPLQADDLDVYRASIDARQRPNVMFVLDFSESMDLDADGNDPSTSGNEARIDILKQAVTSVVDANLDTINFGIASLFRNQASGVQWPASAMRDDPHALDPDIPAGTLTNRDVLISQLGAMSPFGNTATVNGMAEAAAYFRGEPVRHSDTDVLYTVWHTPDTWSAPNSQYEDGNAEAAAPASYVPTDAYDPDSGTTDGFGYCDDYSPSGGANACEAYDPADVYGCEYREGSTFTNDGNAGQVNARLSCKYRTGASWNMPSYQSPVQSCQANAIILVSDGQPTRRRDNTALTAAVGGPIADCEDLSSTIFTESGTDTGNCGPEIAARLATPGSLPGDPSGSVSTYTVGFALDGEGATYLQRLATAGGGTSLLASNLDTLTTALNTQLGQIGSSNQSFAEVAVDVDRANFAHEDRAYFTLFEPSSRTAWQGNMKGYFVSPTGLLGLDRSAATTTVNGVEVFSESAHSFWSDEIDGDDALLGGASEQLTAAPGATAAQVAAAANARNLYTYLGPRADGTPIALAGVSNRALATNNPDLTPATLGVADAATKDALITQLRSAPMGDPLHSRSVGLQYPTMKVVYTMTNQGLLHAFDATRPNGDAASAPVVPDNEGGEELWAFMPDRLLPNLPELFSGATGDDHVYGLDGGITRWHDDSDNDGVVDAGETMMLIIGMRRGGDSYYALDVSEPLNPKLVWELNPSVAGFARLGETWSRASLVTAASSSGTDGKERFLVIGGGYDAATLDDSGAPTPSRGNGLFVVDQGGSLVASVTGDSVSQMAYAITADPTVIDSNADGLADRVYVGDLGGQVWRIDFTDMRNQAGYTTTRLAELADNSHQPFFYSPSVAYNQAAGETFLSVSLGSGDRTDPLDDASDNAFFMLRDTDVEAGPPAASFSTIGPNDLHDTTSNAVGSADTSVAEVARQALAGKRGWRIDLEAGEKSLSKVVSFEGKLLATTFEPSDTIAAGECGPTPIGRFYLMDIIDGRPLELDSSGSTVTTSPDGERSRLLNSGGIPSSPMVLFPKGASQVQIVVDKEVVDLLAQGLTRVFWHAR